MNSIVIRSVCRLNFRTSWIKLAQTTGLSYAIQSNSKVCPTPVLSIHRRYATPHSAQLKSSQLQAFDKLQSDYDNLGFVNTLNFRKLLECLNSDKVLNLTTNQTVFLLESCVPDLMPSQTDEVRMELFNKVWDHLKSNDALQKEHYISFLKVHGDNGVAIENFHKFLEESRLSQNPELFERLVEFACQLGDIKLATEVLAEMKTKGFSLTENVFNALIMGHAKNADIAKALIVLETMKAARVEPSSSTFTQLIGAYIKSSDIDKAMDVFSLHSKHFNSQQILTIIKMLPPIKEIVKKRKFIDLLVNELPTEFLISQEVPTPIRNFCTELIHSGKLEEAVLIINSLPCPKFNENQDIDTYGYIFLQDLFRFKTSPEKIIEIAKELIESGKNTRALHICCDRAIQRNPEIAYIFLEALSHKEPLRPHYFWPLLMHKFRHKGEAGVLDVLKMMSELNVECDNDTLFYYVFPKLSFILDNPQQAIKKLEGCGLKTSCLLSPLIAQLIEQQKLDEIVNISQIYTSKLNTKLFIQPLAHLGVRIKATKRYQKYTNAIHTLHLKTNDPKFDFVGQVLLQITKHNKLRNDVNMLERIISDLSRLGTKISPNAVELLNAHIVRIKPDETDVPKFRQMLATMTDRKLNLHLTDTNSKTIVHPRDMTYDELECHLLELEAKDMNTRGVLRRLLQICVRDNKLERALEVKKKCDLARVQLSPGMMASIFDMYIKLKDYPSAKLSLKKLEAVFPGFLVDEHKILDFAALMIKNGDVEKAKQVLSDRAASTKVFGGDYVIKNVWNVLNAVAHKAAEQTELPKDINLTKDMYYFLRRLGFCNAHNAILGPIIREYLLRKDIGSAIAEFKYLAETFRHTPLQFELSSLLVRLSNGENSEMFDITKDEAKELLQQLTQTVSSIHGEVNMNSSLLLAVAESGTENQLRKLLINPEFRINNDMLARNCEHLNKEGSVQTLMRLAKACRGLNHVIKEHDVYDMLLMKFVEDNNYDASLELFEKLVADDELKISQEFLKNLVNLLKINKLEIPSSLALRAHVI